VGCFQIWVYMSCLTLAQSLLPTSFRSYVVLEEEKIIDHVDYVSMDRTIFGSVKLGWPRILLLWKLKIVTGH